MPHSLLIVDDEKHTRDGLVMALEDIYDIYEASNVEEALRLLDEEEFDVVLTDLRMGSGTGMAVVDKVRGLKNRPVGIMMTAYGDVGTAVEAMKRGAFDFLTKPVDLDRLEAIIAQGLRVRQKGEQAPEVEVKPKAGQVQVQESFVGESDLMKEVWGDLMKVAPSQATVLLIGETGTGKEVFAQALHSESNRKESNFMAVHCASLSSNILESELFGHEKGAFTGAVNRKVGRFELADKGTLFLDEIGEIDAHTQVKLLRFLETKQFERVGGTQTLEVDVRLVCATNRDLEAMVKEGTFREDLYYRLNVVTLELPPLRERGGDVELLVGHFLEYYGKQNGVEVPGVSDEAMGVLTKYRWPGNIRELRNLCERMVVMHGGGVIGVDDLDAKVRAGGVEEVEGEDSEQEAIRQALHKAGGNKTKAAEILGISRRTLHRKLAQWPHLDQ